MGFPVCYESPSQCDVFADGAVRDTVHVHTCSGRIRMSDATAKYIAPDKPVSFPRIQILIRHVVTSPVHTIRSNVTSVYAPK
jgi:hypothetical protein